MIRKLLLILILSFSTQIFAQDDTLVTYNLRGFYKWYIQQSAGTNINPFQAKVTKNKKGYAEMQLTEYANIIRSTKFFTEGFVEKEMARLQPCANEVSKYKFAKWEKLKMSMQPPPCAMYYDYWLQAQDVPDGIVIKKVDKKGFAATVSFAFYTGPEKEYYEWETGGVASMEVHNSQWLVGAIEFKK